MNVNFPDHVWAQLANQAEKQGVKIADLLVGATRAVLSMEPEPCPLPHVKPLRSGPGRPPKVDWEDHIIADQIRALHDMHRSIGEVAAEFDVSWDSMRVAYRHLGIIPHGSKTNTKEKAA